MEIASGKLEARVALEALDPVFRIVLRNAITNALFPVVVAAVFWSQIDYTVLIGWVGLFLTVLASKYRLAVVYTKQDVPCSDVALWGRRISVATLFTSLLWASTAFLFYVEGSVEYQLFLFIVLNALSIGAAVAGLYWLPLFYLRAGSITGALAVRFALEGTFTYITLAVILLAGLAGMSVIAKTLNRAMRSEIRQRFESDALNAELHASTLEAQQATMAKSRFLAAASHDLRQPLHALALFIDVLKEEENEAERKVIMPRIELSLDALRKLCDALLDVSRLDANVITPEYRSF